MLKFVPSGKLAVTLSCCPRYLFVVETIAPFSAMAALWLGGIYLCVDAVEKTKPI